MDLTERGDMTQDQQTERLRKALSDYRDKAAREPEKARERLMKTGIWTKDGNLTQAYGGKPEKGASAA